MNTDNNKKTKKKQRKQSKRRRRKRRRRRMCEVPCTTKNLFFFFVSIFGIITATIIINRLSVFLLPLVHTIMSILTKIMPAVLARLNLRLFPVLHTQGSQNCSSPYPTPTTLFLQPTSPPSHINIFSLCGPLLLSLHCHGGAGD